MDVAWIRLLVLRELASFSTELDLFPDERLVWTTAPGVTNPAGTLALHVAGNLQYYVGAVLGGTGYVRDRDREFGARNVPRSELSGGLRRTSTVVGETLSALPNESLALEYPDVLGGVRVPTGLFLLHLEAHLAHHLGQAGYLRRLLTGENRSSGAVPIKALAGRR